MKGLKIMKKLISCWLALVMVTIISAQAFAQEYYIEEKYYGGTQNVSVLPLTLYDSAIETRRKSIYEDITGDLLGYCTIRIKFFYNFDDAYIDLGSSSTKCVSNDPDYRVTANMVFVSGRDDQVEVTVRCVPLGEGSSIVKTYTLSVYPDGQLIG